MPEEVIAPVPGLPTDPETAQTAPQDRIESFQKRIAASKNYRKKLLQNWTVNIDYRRGKPFASQTDEDSISVNLDWSFTKAKITALFSQVPQVRVNHPPESTFAGPWLGAFERRVNDTIVTAGVEAAFEEVLPDCINAAGISAAIVSYEAVTEDREVPAIDISSLPPELVQEALTLGTIGGEPIPTDSVPVTIDHRYTIRRISPSDLLVPTEYQASDFDNGGWIGRSGRTTWPNAMRWFRLSPEDKQRALTDNNNITDQLTHDYDRDIYVTDDEVGFDEVFYRESEYSETPVAFDRIHHLVFLHGLDKPVIDEVWKGQDIDEETGSIIGALQFPIRVLTLTYITDEPIPPSDSAVARPQVNEINKGRSQIVRQRERSIPVRWFDVNRIDPAIQHTLMRGVWQAAIPVQGQGDRVIGEVARANRPGEDYAFDATAKQDLQEVWSVGPNQIGAGTGIETQGEASIVQASFTSKIGRERARVGAFFVGIARVLGGLMCLYEDPSSFGDGFHPRFSRLLRYSILADSTVLIDANQRLQRLNNFVNMYGKSGWIQLEPVLKEVATLVGLDPNVVVKPPEPAPPEQPNMSIRFTGSEDLMNPLVLATLMRNGQAPPAELIEQAKQLIEQAIKRPVPGESGPEGAPTPDQPAPAIGDANPTLGLMPHIGDRSDDPGAAQ